MTSTSFSIQSSEIFDFLRKIFGGGKMASYCVTLREQYWRLFARIKPWAKVRTSISPIWQLGKFRIFVKIKFCHLRNSYSKWWKFGKWEIAVKKPRRLWELTGVLIQMRQSCKTLFDFIALILPVWSLWNFWDMCLKAFSCMSDSIPTSDLLVVYSRRGKITILQPQKKWAQNSSCKMAEYVSALHGLLFHFWGSLSW